MISRSASVQSRAAITGFDPPSFDRSRQASFNTEGNPNKRAPNPQSIRSGAGRNHNYPEEIDSTMLNETAEVTVGTAAAEQLERAPAAEKAAAKKEKPKPPKPKPVANTGPLFLLLYSNGKYKELKESELTAEAAGVLKDPTLRLVKGQCMVPEISFKLADE